MSHTRHFLVKQLRIWLCFAILVIAAPWAQAERRVALIIGNAAYRDGALANPLRDATDMQAKLVQLGFKPADIVFRQNLKRDDIGPTLREFKTKLQAEPGAVALVFYAGHGVQSKGENYFPAVDAQIGGDEDLPLQSLQLRTLMTVLSESGSRINLLFLDACRNNPYGRSFRSATQGLSRLDQALPTGTLIAYATRPNQVASDGSSRNGTFTGALLEHLGTPGATVEQVFKRVVRRVRETSAGQQEPWSEGALDGDFYFVPGTGGAGQPSRDWPLWQRQMQREFDRVNSMHLSRDLQARAWERFIEAWSENNPESSADEELRSTARAAIPGAMTPAKTEMEWGLLTNRANSKLDTELAFGLGGMLVLALLAALMTTTATGRALPGRTWAIALQVMQWCWARVPRLRRRSGRTHARSSAEHEREEAIAFGFVTRQPQLQQVEDYLARFPNSERHATVLVIREQMLNAFMQQAYAAVKRRWAFGSGNGRVALFLIFSIFVGEFGLAWLGKTLFGNLLPPSGDLASVPPDVLALTLGVLTLTFKTLVMMWISAMSCWSQSHSDSEHFPKRWRVAFGVADDLLCAWLFVGVVTATAVIAGPVIAAKPWDAIKMVGIYLMSFGWSMLVMTRVTRMLLGSNGLAEFVVLRLRLKKLISALLPRH